MQRKKKQIITHTITHTQTEQYTKTDILRNTCKIYITHIKTSKRSKNTHKHTKRHACKITDNSKTTYYANMHRKHRYTNTHIKKHKLTYKNTQLPMQLPKHNHTHIHTHTTKNTHTPTKGTN